MNTYRGFIPVTALALAMSAAVPAMAETTVVVADNKREYVYYGDHEIYFRPETKTYYWRENGTWKSGIELPAASRRFATTGGVTIELDTERPYERHDEVVTRYRTTNPSSNTTTERVVQTNPDGSSTTTTTTTKQKYDYYGDHDIYFAPERKTYYWRENGRWVSGTTLPPASRSFVTSGGMTIELDTELPYTRQDYVVTQYKEWDSND